MLVLSRKIGEQIVVPSCDIRIEVLRIAGGRVRLAFSAPPQIAVHRTEVLERAAASRRTEPRIVDGANGAAVRVLVADPDVCLANSYSRFLTERGFRSSMARSALDCVHRLRTEVPDLLILDPDLPWGGGGGVLSLMRQDHTVPLVPTLIHTWDKGVATFCDEVFPVVRQVKKPLVLHQLEEEVYAMMERFAPRPPLAAAGQPDTEIVEALRQWIVQRSAGRVRALRVESRDERIVVRGVSDTYYGLQLVQAAVMEMLNELGVGRPEEVEIDVAVRAKPR